MGISPWLITPFCAAKMHPMPLLPHGSCSLCLWFDTWCENKSDPLHTCSIPVAFFGFCFVLFLDVMGKREFWWNLGWRGGTGTFCAATGKKHIGRDLKHQPTWMQQKGQSSDSARLQTARFSLQKRRLVLIYGPLPDSQ